MTSENQLTRESAAALVDLIRTIRPAWDARATLDALAEVRDKGDTAWVAYRALKVALNPAAATPRALTFAEHWTEPDTFRRTNPQPPRTRLGEFRVTDAAPASHAAARIAELRQIVRDNPPQPPRKANP